ncbi:TonB-dependent receptor [Pseudohalioglobus lutimaris]|uniref:TonB-dependent receptor n=1 Tax=Pseudohalioglobus lutimaris TaxID=1737061 RepID=A0A2N5X707_9GAMM|nr:hypothetical protein C0039_03410 [Pseudohalioglobus lutimaris]
MNLTTFNIAEPQIFLRGIGTTNDSAASDPAVAIFVDEVYLGRPGGASTDLYDLERIEVLRGPQGTLYGKNVAGGAINIFSKKPQQEFEARAGVTAGNYDLLKVNAYVNGPLSDTIAGKITISTHDRDGYADNVTTGQELEDMDAINVRSQLLFTPSDRVEVLLGVDYNDIDSNGESRFITDYDTPALSGLASIPAFLEIGKASVAGLDERESSHGVVQHAEKEILGFLGRVDVDMDWGVLTSITAYRESETSWLQSLTPVQGQPPIAGDRVAGLSEVIDGANEDADQFSQEFRLSGESDSIKWVAGLYYIKENVERDETFVTWWDPITPLAGLSPGDVTYFQDATTESYAVFGQATWNATDAQAFTLGARYTEDDKEIKASAVNNLDSPIGGIPLVAPGYDTAKGQESWDDTTLRGSVEWTVADDQLLYVTYSEGFKSGIFPSQAKTGDAATTPIDPEQATNIEIGAKTQWWDNRLRFNIAYFDLDYDDLQVFFLANNVLNSANANAEVSGIELDFALALTENLLVTGSYANMDGEYTEYQLEDDDFSGNELSRAPEETWTLSGTYTIGFDSGAALDLVTTVSHTGDYFMEASNDLRSVQESFEVWDASANYTAADGSWTLSVWGKNLDDELYSSHKILGTFGGVTNLWAPPRTYGMSFNYYWL